MINFSKSDFVLYSRISQLYRITRYSSCLTLKQSGYETDIRNYMISNLGFSVKLADQLIKNSLEENLPAGLKTEELRMKNKNEIMKMKGI